MMDKMNDLILKKDKKCKQATEMFHIDFAKYFLKLGYYLCRQEVLRLVNIALGLIGGEDLVQNWKEGFLIAYF